MEQVPRLPDRYLDDARQMIAQHIQKKNCKACYGRGYYGTNQNNMLVTCNKCVDEEALMETWRAFVRDTPELAELYGDYYEEEAEDEEGEEGEDDKKDEPQP